jgi:hypothetical protein
MRRRLRCPGAPITSQRHVLNICIKYISAISIGCLTIGLSSLSSGLRQAILLLWNNDAIKILTLARNLRKPKLQPWKHKHVRA